MASGTRFSMDVSVPAQGTAGTLQNTVVGEALRAGILASARIVPNAAITANGTNFRVLTIKNKGQTGVGTTSMASRTWAATNSVAADAEAMTLDATPANLVVAAGDVISVEETIGGTGLAHGGFRVRLTFDPVA